MDESESGDKSMDEEESLEEEDDDMQENEEEESAIGDSDSPRASSASSVTSKSRRHLVWSFFNVDDAQKPPLAFCTLCKGSKRKKPYKNPQSSYLKNMSNAVTICSSSRLLIGRKVGWDEKKAAKKVKKKASKSLSSSLTEIPSTIETSIRNWRY